MVQTTAIVSELRDLSDQQNDRSSINVLEQISELSRQFRRRIARGDTPKIERFLGKVAESGRENLFTNLLDIEISYRRSQGDSPTSAEYLKIFISGVGSIRPRKPM